jgi:hypothetical protein
MHCRNSLIAPAFGVSVSNRHSFMYAKTPNLKRYCNSILPQSRGENPLIGFATFFLPAHVDILGDEAFSSILVNPKTTLPAYQSQHLAPKCSVPPPIDKPQYASSFLLIPVTPLQSYQAPCRFGQETTRCTVRHFYWVKAYAGYSVLRRTGQNVASAVHERPSTICPCSD